MSILDRKCFMEGMMAGVMRAMSNGRLILIGALLGIGCVKDRGVLNPAVAASTVIGSLTASPPNAILAVGGTQQVSVSAVSLTGTPITAFDSVVYALNTPGDSLRVRVGAQGLVTGVTPSTAFVPLNVFAFQGGGVKGDQVVLQVTVASVPGATLSIQPPDSAKWSAGLVRTITPIIRNPTTGTSVANPALKYTVKSADLTRLRVYLPTLQIPGGGTRMTVQAQPSPSANPNQILPLAGAGTAWVYAAVNAYGTLLQDSVLYALSYPYTLQLTAQKTNLALVMAFGANQTILLAPGATVTFRNGVPATDPLTMTFTFDTPTAATAATPPSTIGGATGNITTLIGGQSTQRRFLTPGTYHWTVVGVGGPAPWNGQTLAGVLMIQ